jgi:DNA-directed RNA polymerase subunit K/omega
MLLCQSRARELQSGANGLAEHENVMLKTPPAPCSLVAGLSRLKNYSFARARQLLSYEGKALASMLCHLFRTYRYGIHLSKSYF